MPNVHVKVDPATGKDAQWLIQELRNGDPAIATTGHATNPQIVKIDVRICEEEEIAEISRRAERDIGVGGASERSDASGGCTGVGCGGVLYFLWLDVPPAEASASAGMTGCKMACFVVSPSP